jgi:transcription-repair coupling factor (superfamily II helicase)
MYAYIPDAYIDDVNQRLTWYKRLAALKRAEDKVLIAEEMSDRYGPLPDIVETLIEVMDVRRRLATLAISEAKVRGGRLSLRVHASSPLAGEALVGLVQTPGRRYSLSPDGTLGVPLGPDPARVLVEVRDVVTALEEVASRARAAAEARAAVEAS